MHPGNDKGQIRGALHVYCVVHGYLLLKFNFAQLIGLSVLSLLFLNTAFNCRKLKTGEIFKTYADQKLPLNDVHFYMSCIKYHEQSNVLKVYHQKIII